MTYTVTITSQGQISIPAKIRRKFGLDKTKQATVSIRDDEIIIKPIKDFLDLKGSLKTNIKATPKQIREAFGEYLAERAIRGLK